MPDWWQREFGTGFPRTRGDRPCAASQPSRALGRGSPARAGIDLKYVPTGRLVISAGSPARAGIDLYDVMARTSASVTVGSPARAGIDRWRRLELAAQAILGFPRTRGDRPVHRVSAIYATSVPPHARG